MPDTPETVLDVRMSLEALLAGEATIDETVSDLVGLVLKSCPTCGAEKPDDNLFCSDGFHAKGPLYWPCEYCAGTGNAHARTPTT